MAITCWDDSILIEINESNQVTWKMEKETDDHWESITPITIEGDNVIPLTIYNTKQLILPATGGSRVWIGYYGRHCADGAGNPYGYILHAAMQKGGR